MAQEKTKNESPNGADGVAIDVGGLASGGGLASFLCVAGLGAAGLQLLASPVALVYARIRGEPFLMVGVVERG